MQRQSLCFNQRILSQCSGARTVMGERYAFTAEWYDINASMIKRYQLLFYSADNTVEMFDIKNRRLFLKRSKCERVKLNDLYIGAIVNIHSRQLTIVDFGDEFTTKKLSSIKEKTFGLIKPDCVPSKMGEIIDRIISEGFIICQLKMVQLSSKEAAEFYQEHRGKSFYEKLVDFMASGPVVVFELTGDNAVTRWRELMGPTDSSVARQEAPHTIRAQFGTDVTRDAVHGSDSQEAAKREYDFFFGSKASNLRKNTDRIFQNCTLGLIKPHAVLDGQAGKIITAIRNAGFNISALQLYNMEKANTEELYEVYKGVVAEYSSMVEELTSGPCIALEITGDGAHSLFRELVGPHDPEIARHLRPDTLRAQFGVNKVKNALHCSDLLEDGPLEVEYFFKIMDS
ncbi:nucleoside diphosphate kinase homolog 7-like [Halichondria panicea]|uniref:nucleoside diphosphate kinase homolog 7-like n=1 Tax=Halichondria panicea TaxID=6063 RepID=UPI00312BC3EB